MGNRDTIGSKHIILMLDKARTVRFTLRALLLLEDIYGTVGKALTAFGTADNGEKLVSVTVSFIYAVAGGGLTKSEIEDILTADLVIEAYKKVREALENDFPATGSSNQASTDESYDWDSMYYIGRYKLQMSDDEFWGCTPKRYSKLKHMWCVENGIETDEPKLVSIDEIAW